MFPTTSSILVLQKRSVSVGLNYYIVKKKKPYNQVYTILRYKINNKIYIFLLEQRSLNRNLILHFLLRENLNTSGSCILMLAEANGRNHIRASTFLLSRAMQPPMKGSIPPPPTSFLSLSQYGFPRQSLLLLMKHQLKKLSLFLFLCYLPPIHRDRLRSLSLCSPLSLCSFSLSLLSLIPSSLAIRPRPASPTYTTIPNFSN